MPTHTPLGPHVQSFGGWVRRYTHESSELGCSMNFMVFTPACSDQAGSKVPVRGWGSWQRAPLAGGCRRGGAVPCCSRRLKAGATAVPPPQVLYYLSGLTCTDENFMLKAGAQRKAAELGVALVAPDTSPRGLGIEGEDDRCGGVQCVRVAVWWRGTQGWHG